MKKLSLGKIYGGKYQHAPWIIEHFPKGYESLEYVEAFGGLLSPALQKKPSFKETLNDFYYPTYCLYVSVQNGDLHKAVQYLPYTEQIFQHYKTLKPTTVLDHAVQQFVLHRMSRGGMKKDFAWSDRLRGGKPGDVNAWENAISSLPQIAHRFRFSVFRNDDFRTLLQLYGNNPNVFFYLDPPYLLETRTSKSVYELEFTVDDHKDLLIRLLQCKAKWLLSGYDSDLYNKIIGPPIASKTVSLSSSQAKKKNKKVEQLWSNY